eukprot:CAMPEP_0118799992 /NCGR_PEP_ID=MMETSP1161-20130426/2038_1 /TAXON_ID=249345 /ORGANISM="Picochlorum oklahomensis, Strain CCMP2329" /LENGTH=89 /DNA_ID=CAMNT_0006727771 /DNA_START=140 /DNA_END=409 /DNA_ORIENTATION=+
MPCPSNSFTKAQCQFQAKNIKPSLYPRQVLPIHEDVSFHSPLLPPPLADLAAVPTELLLPRVAAHRLSPVALELVSYAHGDEISIPSSV